MLILSAMRWYTELSVLCLQQATRSFSRQHQEGMADTSSHVACSLALPEDKNADKGWSDFPVSKGNTANCHVYAAPRSARSTKYTVGMCSGFTAELH